MNDKIKKFLEDNNLFEASPPPCKILAVSSKYTCINRRVTSILLGMKSKRKGYYYPRYKYNTNLFCDKELPIPENYTYDSNIDKKYVADQNKHHAISVKLEGYNYLTHDNGGRPFRVNIRGDTLNIYKTDPKEYIWDFEYDIVNVMEYYSYLVKSYKVDRIWIGDDSYDPYDPIASEKIGNSVLARIWSNSVNPTYIFVGNKIYTFQTDNDQINEFYSPVGNNDVPYPVAESDNKYYFMLDSVEMNKNGFVRSNGDLYFDFYGHAGQAHTSAKIPFKRTRIIHDRIW